MDSVVPLHWVLSLHDQQDVANRRADREFRYWATSDCATSTLYLPFLLRIRSFRFWTNFLCTLSRRRFLLVPIQIAGMVVGQHDRDCVGWPRPFVRHVAPQTLVRVYLALPRFKRPCWQCLQSLLSSQITFALAESQSNKTWLHYRSNCSFYFLLTSKIPFSKLFRLRLTWRRLGGLLFNQLSLRLNRLIATQIWLTLMTTSSKQGPCSGTWDQLDSFSSPHLPLKLICSL